MYTPPFTVTNKMINLVSAISQKVERQNQYTQLKKMPILRRDNRIKSIYSSLAIEANSLSLEETKDVIDGKIVIGPQKEIQEVKNAFDAYEAFGSYNPLSEKDLLRSHETMSRLLISESGRYRSGQEGVFDGDKCIFVAPPAKMVPSLMEKLFEWINKVDGIIHPLIVSSVFHYEFVFIHPFSDCNGRTARLWQNVILARWNSLFEFLPIESQIKKYQSDYYAAIDTSNKNGNSTEFIEFMLSMIDKTLEELSESTTIDIRNISSYVGKLLAIFKDREELSSNEIMERLGIKSKENLRANYLNPALENGLVKMTIPDKPNSRNQKYYKAINY